MNLNHNVFVNVFELKGTVIRIFSQLAFNLTYLDLCK